MRTRWAHARAVRRLGAGRVSAIDPSPPFVAACRERVPGAEVVLGVAEALPFADDGLLGLRDGELAALLEGAGLVDVRSSEIVATALYDGLDDLWSGYTAGIGPIGQYVRTLGDDQLDAVRTAVRDDREAPDGPFTLPAVAWAARGAVPV